MPNAQVEARRMRRSLLFVPGGEPRKIERARDAAADTVLLDLEDAVPLEQKAQARALVAEALRAGGFGDAEVAVRVNAPGTPDLEADLAAVIAAGGRTIMLPKAESAEEIARLAEALRVLEARGGGGGGEGEGEGRETPGGCGAPEAPEARVKLLLLVESPAGVASALAIVRASPLVEALCFGHADFSLQMGLAQADASQGVAYHARCALAIAAKACGVSPIDTVHLAVKDEAAFREDALLGLRLGFDGKLCIHPRQAEIANEVYTPSRAEIDYALRVVEAAERARLEGRGVFTLDGKMVDAPLVLVQRRVLDRARRASPAGV